MIKSLQKSDLFILAGLSFCLFLYHILTSAFSGYGYFIDELYFIACSKRLAFGYIDQPPFSIVMLAMSRWMLGDSLPAVRFLPALGMAANVFMTGLIAHQLGGSRRAMIIAALAAMVMPVYLLFGSFYSMNAFEPLIWTAMIYFVIRLVQEDQPEYLLFIGLLMGAGLEMKHTIILYGIALTCSILLTKTRRYLWKRWSLFGLLACILLILPNITWQITHGFPSLELYQNSMGGKNITRMPWNVFMDQILFANPFSLPLWFAGLIFFFKAGDGRYRFLVWAYLLLLLIMTLGGSSRPDRIAAIYTALFAGGAAALDQFMRPALRKYSTGAMVALLILGGIIFAPMFTPLLPPPVLRKYLSELGIKFDIEKGKMNEPLPQWLADRLGWRELAANVALVYHSLSREEQKNAVIISTNYGEAGALELYGPEFSLPPVFCTHNSFHEWGPPSDSIRTYIGVYVEYADIRDKFDSVLVASVATCDDCTRPQRRIPIYIARGPRFSVTREWPKFKNYN